MKNMYEVKFTYIEDGQEHSEQGYVCAESHIEVTKEVSDWVGGENNLCDLSIKYVNDNGIIFIPEYFDINKVTENNVF